MKISIFSAFYPFRGGIAQFNARLFRSLEKKQEVQAFTFKQQYPDFLFPGTSQYVTEKDDADVILAQRIVSTFNPFTYFFAARAIRKSQPDLFIANYWMTFFSLFLAVMSKSQRRKTRKIAIIHNLIPHEPRFFDKMLNSLFVKSFEGFIVMSDAVENDLLSLKPNAKYLKLLHPWYDHFGEKINENEAKNYLKVHLNKKTILFFGLVRDYKGLDLLIDSFSMLNDDYQLVIAGEVYSNLLQYENQIRESGASNRIFLFNKYIPDNEVKYFFSAADLCVLPYRTATQSGITATSFHFEIPIIATNVGGLKEIVGHEKKGLIVEEPNAELITNAIKEYFQNDLKEKFKANIREEKKLNTWDSFAESVVNFGNSL
jgi:glycosyltransferase involved in cell wall biosynthesis